MPPINNTVPPVPLTPPEDESVKPSLKNYAGFAFFVSLIVGFTFNLPSFMYLPVTFFCVVAGLLFLTEIFAKEKTKLGNGVVIVHQRSFLSTFLRVIFTIIGIGVLLIVGLFILIFIAFGGGRGPSM